MLSYRTPVKSRIDEYGWIFLLNILFSGLESRSCRQMSQRFKIHKYTNISLSHLLVCHFREPLVCTIGQNHNIKDDLGWYCWKSLSNSANMIRLIVSVLKPKHIFLNINILFLQNHKRPKVSKLILQNWSFGKGHSSGNVSGLIECGLFSPCLLQYL